ncbi:MAG: flagellar biosynthesis protein FlhB [Candidatus Margulisiibacteriota bacterium]
MGEQGGDKTEEPTPHRLREARQKGQIAKSKEVTTALLLLSSYVVLRFMGEFIWGQLTSATQSIFEQIPYTGDFGMAFAGSILLIGLRGLLFAVAPLFGVAFVVAFLAEALQTGFASSADPLSPKLERINPLEGFKRMFSLQGFVELIKSLLKVIIVFWITWSTAKEDLPNVVSLIDSHPWQAIVLGGSIAYNIAIRVAVFYIFIAGLDYLYKRWEYMKNLRMTKQEVKEEYKRLEGDPMIKQRIRELQRQVAYQRMMSAVPGADVVVTNPTHLAVALLYDASRMKSPTVVAKGQMLVAEEIKKIAEEHYVPVIENEVLARAIYRTTKVGSEVSGELYQAVAEVLAFVYKIKKDRKQKKSQWLGPLKGIRGEAVRKVNG